MGIIVKNSDLKNNLKIERESFNVALKLPPPPSLLTLLP